MKKAIVLVNVGFGEYNGADRIVPFAWLDVDEADLAALRIEFCVERLLGAQFFFFFLLFALSLC